MWPFRGSRRRPASGSIGQFLAWETVRLLSWVALTVQYRARWWGTGRIPSTGPVLLLSNHQSFLDLHLIGGAICHRHFHSLARATLFNNPLFGWWIRQLSAIPVKQGEADLAAMRSCIEVLKRGETLLMFPEGARTETGEVDAFAEGIMLIIRRARPMVVPMAVEGVYDVWPIWRRWPRLSGRMGLMAGDPIPAEQLTSLPPAEAMAKLRDIIDGMRADVRERLLRASGGRFPRDLGSSGQPGAGRSVVEQREDGLDG